MRVCFYYINFLAYNPNLETLRLNKDVVSDISGLKNLIKDTYFGSIQGAASRRLRDPTFYVGDNIRKIFVRYEL